MLKRSVLIPFCLILILPFCLPPSVSAAEIEPEGTAWRKLQRGFLNIALSPFEYVNEWEKQKKVDSVVPSWVWGIAHGTYKMAGRVLIGVYELATAPFPIPARYEPLIYPEFPWEHFDSE